MSLGVSYIKSSARCFGLSCGSHLHWRFFFGVCPLMIVVSFWPSCVYILARFGNRLVNQLSVHINALLQPDLRFTKCMISNLVQSLVLFFTLNIKPILMYLDCLLLLLCCQMQWRRKVFNLLQYIMIAVGQNKFCNGQLFRLKQPYSRTAMTAVPILFYSVVTPCFIVPINTCQHEQGFL